MRYTTMTVGGVSGSTITADTDDEAVRILTEQGYTVLAVEDGETDDDAIVVVVSDE